MGVKGLSKLIRQHAPNAITEHTLGDYRGRTVAIDASMAIWQVVTAKAYLGRDHGLNHHGDFVGHLSGVLGRLLWLLEYCITPIFVFDGEAPVLKQQVLDERKERRQTAKKLLLQKAAEAEEIEPTLYAQSVRVESTQFEECKSLVRLAGIPVVEAPGEAEAQCAELVRGSKGKISATATEDMDALTFGTPILVRSLNSGHVAGRSPVLEFNRQEVLKGLKLNSNQFVDLCILLGSDYCPRIYGLGPVTAYKGIRQYKSIDKWLPVLAQSFVVPGYKTAAFHDEYCYRAARKLFLRPSVTPYRRICKKELQLTEPREEELLYFLQEKGVDQLVNLDRALKRLRTGHRRCCGIVGADEAAKTKKNRKLRKF